MLGFVRHQPMLRHLLSGLLLVGVVIGAFSALAGAQDDLRRSGQRIDVAGRQRMLTQQIALQSVAAVEAPASDQRLAARGHVVAAVTRMRTEHRALVQGNRAPAAPSGPLARSPTSSVMSRTSWPRWAPRSTRGSCTRRTSRRSTR